MKRVGRRARSAITVGVLVVGLHACGLVVDSCACTLIAPGVSIQGRVLDAGGVGVPSAVVEVWVRNDDCEVAADLQSRADANAEGEYVAYVTPFGVANRVCVDLLAIDVSGPTLDSVWVRDLSLPVSADSIGVVEQDIRF